jgi:Fe-S-cluster containining protein
MAETDCSEICKITFNCEKCGECCRHIEQFIDILPHQQDGICQFLQGDLCSIYEHRPDLCVYKRAYKYLKNYFTESEYLKNVMYFCEQLKSKRMKLES